MTETIDERKKVYDVAKHFDNAMLVTIAASGNPKARPMHVARVDEDLSNIWFLTSKESGLAEDVSRQSSVLLVFQNDNSAFLSLRGKARIVEDQPKIHQLWKEPYKVWFPRGADDPDIALIGVDPVDAEYWDNGGANKLEYLFETAKAYFKGERPNLEDRDRHAKTSL
jgi:general stress protein 26